MDIQYMKAEPVTLKKIGKSERWLQETIEADTSILGLGDLKVLKREKSQPTGGRFDFLMYDPDEKDVRYEIEVMLGTLDESHIMRTIEYWDIEKRRYPSLDHRAVIVAEDITNRFFNIISLLNKAIPIIAIQLNAFKIKNKLVLNFVKVLNLVESGEGEINEGEGERVTRDDWISRSSESSIELMDKIIGIVSRISAKPRVTYNRHHVALATSGSNFCWFHPRIAQGRIHLHLKTGIDDQATIIKKLTSKKIHCGANNNDGIRVILYEDQLKKNAALLKDILIACEQYSRK